MGYNQRNGFTIIELLIAIMILLVIGGGGAFLLVHFIQNAVFIPNQLNMDMLVADALDIMIEGDDATNIDCIYGLPSCNSSTYGDWTEGTLYPIVNDDTLAESYNIAYWPTIYHFCHDATRTDVINGWPEQCQHHCLLRRC